MDACKNRGQKFEEKQDVHIFSKSPKDTYSLQKEKQ